MASSLVKVWSVRFVKELEERLVFESSAAASDTEACVDEDDVTEASWVLFKADVVFSDIIDVTLCGEEVNCDDKVSFFSGCKDDVSVWFHVVTVVRGIVELDKPFNVVLIRPLTVWFCSWGATVDVELFWEANVFATEMFCP